MLVCKKYFVAEVVSNNMVYLKSDVMTSLVLAIDKSPTVRWARSQALLQLKLTVKIKWRNFLQFPQLKTSLPPILSTITHLST